MGRLKDKIAVIGAGGQAIGAGIAMRFAQEGAKVVVLDEDAVAGAQVAQSIDAQFIPVDLSDKASLTAAVQTVGKKYGQIDVMVVGGFVRRRNLETSRREDRCGIQESDRP